MPQQHQGRTHRPSSSPRSPSPAAESPRLLKDTIMRRVDEGKPVLGEIITLHVDGDGVVSGAIFSYDADLDILVICSNPNSEDSYQRYHTPVNDRRYTFRMIKGNSVRSTSFQSQSGQHMDRGASYTGTKDDTNGREEDDARRGRDLLAMLGGGDSNSSISNSKSESNIEGINASQRHLQDDGFYQMIRNSMKQGADAEENAVPFMDNNFPELDWQLLGQREDELLAQRQQTLGEGVSSRAQQIFDALSKTMPCRWEGEDIVVMDEVHIRPPYGTRQCQGGDRFRLQRVKTILGGELEKMV